MATGMLHLHNFMRWLVLLTGIWALVRTLPMLSGKRPVLNSDRKAGLFFMISCDIQLLLGLYLYFSRGWATQLGNGGVMGNAGMRFWTVEHSVGMLLAILLAHIGYASLKRGVGKRAGIMFLFSLLIILLTIPWPFREVIGRGLFPGA
ncbi:MAG: hypothetical protein EOP52_05135 [Sphingobacteriales bacterium]|nr:MAG: hypothetical protein EOP52_05135 [Sphingobacteriales bacterium]